MMHCRWRKPKTEEEIAIVDDEEFFNDDHPGIVIDKSNTQFFDITTEQTQDWELGICISLEFYHQIVQLIKNS